MVLAGLNGFHLVVLVVPLLLTIGVIAAIIVTARDRSIAFPEQFAWIVVLIVFPIVGLAVWLVVRALRRSRTSPKPGV